MDIRKRLADWYFGNNDEEKEPPKAGLLRAGYILVHYSGPMVAANLLFLLTCLPLVTIPAAISAHNAYLGRIYRKGYGYSLREYIKDWKAGILKLLLPGILFGLLIFYACYLISLAGNYADTGVSAWFIGTGLVLLAAGVFACDLFFMLASMTDLPGRHLLKNTLILLILEWKAGCLLLVFTALYLFVCLALAPYSLLLLLPIGASLLCLLRVSVLTPVILRRVISN